MSIPESISTNQLMIIKDHLTKIPQTSQNLSNDMGTQEEYKELLPAAMSSQQFLGDNSQCG